MSDTFVIVLVVWLSLCLLAFAMGEVYSRGKNRGFDDANKLNDQFIDDALRKRGFLP